MRKLTFIIFLLLINISFGQKIALAAGGKAIGSSGTASFSIGQVSYKSPEGSIMSNGVQQPYEIQTLGKSGFTAIQLEMKVYPNPTIDELRLKISEKKFNEYTYQLYDTTGKILLTEKINLEESTINMKNYSTGIYFLDLQLKNESVKIFKILKK